MPGVSGVDVGTSSVAVAVGDGVAVGSSVDVGSSVEVGGGKVGGSGGVGEGPGVKGGGTSVGGTGKVGGGGGVSGVAVAPGIGVGRGTSALLPQSGSTPTLSAPRTAPPVDGTTYRAHRDGFTWNRALKTISLPSGDHEGPRRSQSGTVTIAPATPVLRSSTQMVW